MMRKSLLSHKTILVTGSFIILLMLAAIAAPLISPCDPLQVDLGRSIEAPGAGHWMGTAWAGMC